VAAHEKRDLFGADPGDGGQSDSRRPISVFEKEERCRYHGDSNEYCWQVSSCKRGGDHGNHNDDLKKGSVRRRHFGTSPQDLHGGPGGRSRRRKAQKLGKVSGVESMVEEEGESDGKIILGSWEAFADSTKCAAETRCEAPSLFMMSHHHEKSLALARNFSFYPYICMLSLEFNVPVCRKSCLFFERNQSHSQKNY
jgi:hypothetical protein